MLSITCNWRKFANNNQLLLAETKNITTGRKCHDPAINNKDKTSTFNVMC